MKTNASHRHSTRPARPATRIAAVSVAVFWVAAASAAGCRDESGTNGGRHASTRSFARLTQSAVDKIDLLVSIDTSRSMADKQEILALAVPDLVKGLVNPRCLDENGLPAVAQPAGPLEDCPILGTKREFEPVVDIHIGIVSEPNGRNESSAGTRVG